MNPPILHTNIWNVWKVHSGLPCHMEVTRTKWNLWLGKSITYHFFRRDVNSRKYYTYVFQICLFGNVCVHVCTFKDKYEVSKIKIFVKYYPNYNEVFVGVIFFHTRCIFVRWQNSTVYVSLRLIRGLFGFLRCLTHWGRVKHICVDK